jgi:hypothetical protein
VGRKRRDVNFLGQCRSRAVQLKSPFSAFDRERDIGLIADAVHAGDAQGAISSAPSTRVSVVSTAPCHSNGKHRVNFND